MASCTARSKVRKFEVEKKGGVTGAIVPSKKPVDKFPLMSFVAKNCTFKDKVEDDSLLNEEVLKAENDRRTEEMLNQAAQAVEPLHSRDFSDDERKKALEVLHSLEYARNQEDTWKIPSKTASKKEPNYGGFLHPLKRYDKEDEYFSGTRKAKQPRERRRSRSDEVVLLEEGKLISKNGEPSQLPIKFTHPTSSPRPRVPSVGLPFTPAPPLPAERSVWYQKSGAELFSNVRSNTLVAYGVQCDEDEALALVIAESIRTAKLEQQKILNIRELHSNQCASVTSALKSENEKSNDNKPYKQPPPDPPGTVWSDTDKVGPLAESFFSKDTLEMGAIKKKESIGNRSSVSFHDQTSVNVKKSRDPENIVVEGSSPFAKESLQQRSRYDNERNINTPEPSQSESPLCHISDKKCQLVEFQCKNEDKNTSQSELQKKSLETELVRSSPDLDQKKPGVGLESHEKLKSFSDNHFEQPDLCQVDYESSESTSVTHDSGIIETKCDEHLAFKSASNEAAPERVFVEMESPHEIGLNMKSSDKHLLAQGQSLKEFLSKDQSKKISRRCKHEGYETDGDSDSDGCQRSTRLSRGLAYPVSSSIVPGTAGGMITSSSARLPTSNPALMSAMKTFLNTESETAGSENHSTASTSQYARNQKQFTHLESKSEKVSNSTFSSSQCIKAVDEDINGIKVQQERAGIMVSDPHQDKIQVGVPSNQRPAVNQSNLLHSALAGLPGPYFDPVLPSYMLGLANASASGLPGHPSSFPLDPLKVPSIQAPLSLHKFPSSQTSTIPPVMTDSKATATCRDMPVNLPMKISGKPMNLNVPGGVPGMLNLLPSAHGLPEFHAAGPSEASFGPSTSQPESKNPFAPLSCGVPGIPSMLHAQLPGMPPPLLGAFSGLQNVLPGMPGLTNTMSGIPNFFPGALGGLPPNFCSELTGLENQFATSASGSQKSKEMQCPTPVNFQGLQGQMPTLTAGCVDPFFLSMQGLSGGLRFGGISNAPGAAARSSYNSGLGAPLQPGSSPLVSGKGRGRLAKLPPSCT